MKKQCPICEKAINSLGYARHRSGHIDRKDAALEAAFKICFLIKGHSANVIASGDFGQSDVDNRNYADKFLKWYKGYKKGIEL